MRGSNVVQYILVRGDLELNMGQVAAQVAHASLAPLTNMIRNNLCSSPQHVFDSETLRWIEGPFNKIVLKVPSKARMLDIMERLYADGIQYEKIMESTMGGELTCIGLKPYDKGRVAPYFRGLRLLDNLKYIGNDQIYPHLYHRPRRQKQGKPVSAVVDGRSVSPSLFSYSVQDIARAPQGTNGSRFILHVDLGHLVEKFGSYYNRVLRNLRSHGGTGNDFMDSLKKHSLSDNLPRNDPRYNAFLLSSYYEELLRAVLPEKREKGVVITSLDGIFTEGPDVKIHGGCHVLNPGSSPEY